MHAWIYRYACHRTVVRHPSDQILNWITHQKSNTKTGWNDVTHVTRESRAVSSNSQVITDYFFTCILEGPLTPSYNYSGLLRPNQTNFTQPYKCFALYTFGFTPMNMMRLTINCTTRGPNKTSKFWISNTKMWFRSYCCQGSDEE